MNKFRKKPVVIEAVQITDETFDAPHPNDDHITGVTYVPSDRTVTIPTLEGVMVGRVGDWIIKGVNGELYPCKPDIFEKTYDALDAAGDDLDADLTLVYMKGWQDGQDAVGDDLDVILDSIGVDTWIYRVKRDGFGKWVAAIEVVPDDYIVVGKGATRMEAIANAVKFAKEATDDH